MLLVYLVLFHSALGCPGADRRAGGLQTVTHCGHCLLIEYLSSLYNVCIKQTGPHKLRQTDPLGPTASSHLFFSDSLSSQKPFFWEPFPTVFILHVPTSYNYTFLFDCLTYNLQKNWMFENRPYQNYLFLGENFSDDKHCGFAQEQGVCQN